MQCKSLWIKASAKCINVNVKCKYGYEEFIRKTKIKVQSARGCVRESKSENKSERHFFVTPFSGPCIISIIHHHNEDGQVQRAQKRQRPCIGMGIVKVLTVLLATW